MKSIEEIYREMRADFLNRTGHEAEGTGDLAVRLYAAAAQVHALYVQGEWVTRQCFPQTAAGEYLDRHALLRGLERRDAVKAAGTICFQSGQAAAADLTIPAGTVCMTAGLVRFQTTEEAVLRAGESSVEVRAEAVEGGTAGNAAAGTITAMAVAPVGVSWCTNPAAFTGGMDRESDEELRARVLETFRRMPNGANTAFYQQGAMSFERVAAAAVLPRSRGIGTVDVVVSTWEGLPDSSLLDELTRYFEERREIAVDVTVRAPSVIRVDITVAVAPAEGYSGQEARTAVRDALESWFDGTRLGKKVLRAELSGLIFALNAVGNCAVTIPAEDVAAEADQLPRLGTLTITDMP